MTVAAGVDGCRGGWVAAMAEVGKQPAIAVFKRFSEIVEALPRDAVIAVDMPIGLPDHCGAGGRGPETLVRPLLGMRQSSVFSIPSRAAVYAIESWPVSAATDGDGSWMAAHRRASEVARQTSTPPRGVSIQAFGLFSKIRELDALLSDRTGLGERVIESHPELCFWRLNGRKPLDQPKKLKSRVFASGMAERRALLLGAGLDKRVMRERPPAGAGEDDMLDALAVLNAARNRIEGKAMSFPDLPERDAFGLPIAISC